MARYIQHPETGKLFPASEYQQPRSRTGPDIMADIDPFVSPIDGQLITSRSGLRDHNTRHGVVCAQEFDQNHFDRKAAERADFYEGTHKTAYGRELREKRRQDVAAALTKHGVY